LAEVVPLRAQSCFRGRPLPECRSFWITEFGYAYRINSEKDKPTSMFSGDFGMMRNLNDRIALGGLFFLGIDTNPDFHIGLKARFRYWLNSKNSLEISPGILLVHTRPFTEEPGLTGNVAMNFSDCFAIHSQIEVVRFRSRPSRSGFDLPPEDETDLAIYAGAKLGSKPGLIIGVVGGVITTLVILALLGAD